MNLLGRGAECAELARLVEAVRSGESRALVVHGEAGVGKTALLEYAAGQAADHQVVSASGVQSEMELAFAALHQLCAPLLDRLDAVPAPQRDALRVTFGMSAGPAPDRFLVGLAALGLLSEVAAERPLLCLVDDEQWLDRASARLLAFVARRLGAESVGLLFGSRELSPELAGLPELEIEGLRAEGAHALLNSVLTVPVDTRVRDQIIAETRGNPLALVELPRGLPPAELAGGFGLPGAVALPGSIEDSFRRRADALPADTRRLLVLAAAEPAGDPVLLWRAAGRLGIGAAAAWPAAEAGLVDFGARVRFRHPLVRSAAYQSAPAEQRREVHRALAEVTDPELDPDRRAWHRAQAAEGPDEDVAGELERSAGRAQARGGVSAAAAFLERATVLTPDPARRAGRALAGAYAKVQAGTFDTALELLAVADAGPLSEAGQARAGLVRAQLAFTASRGRDVPALLLTAAKRFEPIDAALARATYLDAMYAAYFAGPLAGPGADLAAAARAAGAAPPPPGAPSAADLLLDGLAATLNHGYAQGLAALRQALISFGSGMPADQQMRWLSFATLAALHVWDDERWEVLTDRYVGLARELGALTELPLALTSRGLMLLFTGELAAAASVIGELQAAMTATGSTLGQYPALGLAAWRGAEAETSELVAVTVRDASRRGEGSAITGTQWAQAVLNNGLGRHDTALAAAQRAAASPGLFGVQWALAELVEAAVRTGMSDAAATASRRLAEMAGASGTDWALGVQARCDALLAEGAEADRLFRESIMRLGRTRVRAELARAHLLYGEWLRQERRRSEARTQLGTAHDMLAGMGIEAFAERARRELRAAGQPTRKRSTGTRGELTPQEAQIAQLARDGLSNPEIGTRLFISARTAEYHLGKVFAKLGITSRGQLDRVLPERTGQSR